MHATQPLVVVSSGSCIRPPCAATQSSSWANRKAALPPPLPRMLPADPTSSSFTCRQSAAVKGRHMQSAAPARGCFPSGLLLCTPPRLRWWHEPVPHKPKAHPLAATPTTAAHASCRSRVQFLFAGKNVKCPVRFAKPAADVQLALHTYYVLYDTQ